MSLNEAIVEDAALTWFGELGYPDFDIILPSYEHRQKQRVGLTPSHPRGRADDSNRPRPLSLLPDYPRLAPIAQRIERQIDLPGTISTIAAWLTNAIASFVRGSVMHAIGLLLTFYLLFYFLRDRRSVLLALCSLSPLSDADMNRVFSRVGDTVHATIYGTLAVAAVQSTLGGLMFWWLGLPAPALWGLVMGALAVVPAVGANENLRRNAEPLVQFSNHVDGQGSTAVEDFGDARTATDERFEIPSSEATALHVVEQCIDRIRRIDRFMPRFEALDQRCQDIKPVSRGRPWLGLHEALDFL